MCPVLVTDAPGMSDIVIDGQTGYVFESNNLDSLVSKIEYIKSNHEEASLLLRIQKDLFYLITQRIILNLVLKAF